LKEKDRPRKLISTTYETEAGSWIGSTPVKVKLLVTVGVYRRRPFEVFVKSSLYTANIVSNCEEVGRLVSLGLRYGIPAELIIKQLKNIQGSREDVGSIGDAVAKILQSYVKPEKGL